MDDITGYRWHQKSSIFYETTYDLRRKSNGLEDFSCHLRDDFFSRTG